MRWRNHRDALTYFGPLFVSLAAAVLLFCPPDYDTWRLTGSHRIVKPRIDPQRQKLLEQSENNRLN